MKKQIQDIYKKVYRMEFILFKKVIIKFIFIWLFIYYIIEYFYLIHFVVQLFLFIY